jgi:hypothetical protein
VTLFELRGRCRPEENVAFNALDEVVDALSHTLERLPYAQLLSVYLRTWRRCHGCFLSSVGSTVRSMARSCEVERTTIARSVVFGAR